jgi:hypothetical protein
MEENEEQSSQTPRSRRRRKRPERPIRFAPQPIPRQLTFDFNMIPDEEENNGE